MDFFDSSSCCNEWVLTPPAMQLTEKLLSSAGGWQAFREARALFEAGAVIDSSYSATVLRGSVRAGGKILRCGLHIHSATDMQNLCTCPDSLRRGIICAHSIAAGLHVLRPGRGTGSAPTPAGTAHSLRKEVPVSTRESHLRPTGEIPQVVLHLEGSTRSLSARIEFEYSTPGAQNADAEAGVLRELIDSGFVDRGGVAVLGGEEAVGSFYANKLPDWERRWRVDVGERFRHVTANWTRLTPGVSLKDRGNGWLDFRIFYTADADAVLTADELRRLLAGGHSSVTLKNGRRAFVNARELEDWEEVLRDCDPRARGSSWEVASQHADYLAASAKHWNARITEDDTGTLRHPVWQAGQLFARLRPYQQDGARWLASLAARGLGGLLADEMGLGKTPQALSMLETLRGRRLVVCPSSLVWNWQQETMRFCPSLHVVRLDGPHRAAAWAGAPEDALFITSYALLRRDVDRYRDVEFSALVLDEAQHIKNPESQNALAARSIRAHTRFVLTGTPLENSILDLWSLFEFLLPNYLGPRKDFQERYEIPLRESSSPAVWERLRRRIAPFYLRRRKAEILAELPAKIEQIIAVPLGPRQRIMYDQLQAAARQKIDLLKKSNSGAARMQALTALLRLRQCCCDARLLGAAPGDASPDEGKLGALLEILDEVIDGGHRALVFSQFTSMLDLIEPAVRAAGHGLVRLDGSTRNRQEVVETFQSNPAIGVFLISLKAGGAGLNLTGADTVIHYDPWWNPAVEAQATDRAHRIGQDRVVTSIKLIAADTVESRVLGLQEEKRAMLAATLDSDSSYANLSWQDLQQILE